MAVDVERHCPYPQHRAEAIELSFIPMDLIMAINWVSLKKYCVLTGEIPGGVITRMKTGGWAKGIHYTIGPDRRRWVNLKEAQKWVEHGHLKTP